jgi:hypothetical protein
LMEIKLTVKSPEQIGKRGEKFVLEADSIDIDDVTEDDSGIFERLYNLGWKSPEYLLGTLCRILPVELLVTHEPRNKLMSVLERLWLNREYDVFQKFRGLLRKEEMEKMVGEVLKDKQESLRSHPEWDSEDWWGSEDYRELSALAKTFPELFEVPGWLAERVIYDLGHTGAYESKPLSRPGRCFAECLVMLAELKKLGKLPEALERAATWAIDRIRDTVIERVCRTDLKSKEDYVRVAEAARVLASDETGAKIAAVLLKTT